MDKFIEGMKSFKLEYNVIELKGTGHRARGTEHGARGTSKSISIFLVLVKVVEQKKRRATARLIEFVLRI